MARQSQQGSSSCRWFRLAGRLRSILTPSVTGTAMVLIGLSLMGVAIDWAAGGRGAPDYGSARNLLLSGLTIGTILLVTRYGNRFMANCAILIGMVCGYLAAIPLGAVAASDIGAAASFRMVTPFHFGCQHLIRPRSRPWSWSCW
jgi:NCS2 family nucleobase:cation symporter-2